MKSATGHSGGIDAEVLPVTKGASIVEMYIRYYNAISNNMADNYYPLDTRPIWELVLYSRHTLQRIIGSNFILGFSFLLWEATLGSRWSISPSNKDTGMKIVDMNCIQTIFVVMVATIISLPSRWMSNKCRGGTELLLCFY